MTFLGVSDVAFDPLKVAFFGAVGVMFAPNGIAHYFWEHFGTIPVPGGVANVHKIYVFSEETACVVL